MSRRSEVNELWKVLRGIEVKSRISEIATKFEKKNIYIFLNFVALSEYIDFT